MAAGASRMTVSALAEELAVLRELVLSRARLHRKEVLLRYGISKDTLYRRMKRGLFPKPSKIAGPVWPLAVLEAAERAGVLPAPKDSQGTRTPPNVVPLSAVAGVRRPAGNSQ
jgi:hypothetical protein